MTDPGEGPVLTVRTPEGVEFRMELAGVVSRLCAASIDTLCVAAIVMGVGALCFTLVLASPDIAMALLILAWFTLQTAFAGALEWWWNGQTVGKRVLGLRVIDAGGLRLTPGQVIVRNLVRPVDLLPAGYLVGGLACLLTRRRQRLGDLAAGTVVVRATRRELPDLRRLFELPHNSLRDRPHLEARLRQRVPPAEARVALAALARRDELEPAARVALFAEIVERWRSRRLFDDEVLPGLSDEAVVRAVVDSLLRVPASAGISGGT